MKTIAIALVAGATLLLSTAASFAQDRLSDALEMLETDPVRALAALESLAEGGDNEARNAVAVVINSPPEGVARDEARALRLWEQSAAGGSDGARLNLATQLLLNGDPADDARAVSMLREIRNEELIPLTAYPLARAALFGNGMERNLAEGSRLMAAAVETTPTNIDARFLLGRAYQNGWGIPVDSAAAYRHLKVAADGGDARAMWNVGMALLNGEGVTANPAQAYRYVRTSAEAGFESGMISLAVMLAVGQGVERDPGQAREWYRRAAENGSAHALRGLAGMLLTGEGGRVDPVTGAAYLDLAAKAGDEYALRMQQVFAAQLASLDQGAVEAAKTAWVREHGIPR